jgi:hypothetical protein
LRQFLFSFAADGCLTSWADEIATKAGGTTIKNNTEVRLKQMTLRTLNLTMNRQTCNQSKYLYFHHTKINYIQFSCTKREQLNNGLTSISSNATQAGCGSNDILYMLPLGLWPIIRAQVCAAWKCNGNINERD